MSAKVQFQQPLKLVFFAGQVGMNDPSNSSPSLGDQVWIALENVDICLEAAGVTKSDIISVRQYLVKSTSMSTDYQNARSEPCKQWWEETEGDNAPPPLTDSLYREECLCEVEVKCVGKL